VTKLKKVIAHSIDTHQLYTSATVRQLLSAAVRTFGNATTAQFDFLDVSAEPLDEYAKNLVEFFDCTFRYYKDNEGMTPQGANESAYARLFERLLDSFHHYTLRNDNPPLQRSIEEIDKRVKMSLPCVSTKKYPKIGDPVHCESTLGCHGGVHQSSLTYNEVISATPGAPDTLLQACRWAGDFKPQEEYKSIINIVNPRSAASVTAADFMPQHKQLLAQHQDLVTKLGTTRFCADCICATSTQVLQCKHALCTKCFNEHHAGGVIKCPVCNQKAKWVPGDKIFSDPTVQHQVLLPLPFPSHY
jgi:hypothetical protein